MARTRSSAALAVVRESLPPRDSTGTLVASAQEVFPSKSFAPRYDQWQLDLWNYWRGVPEFYGGVQWMSNAMSRIRLVAATVTDDGTEPERLEDGPAVDAMNRLAGGVGGQSQLMGELATHFQVPGVCWLVGEVPDPSSPFAQWSPTEETWRVLSASELRIAERSRAFDRRNTYEIREREGDTNRSDGGVNRAGVPPVWRPINPDSMVSRMWRPDPQFGWRSTSPGQHALPALIELDLINKRILAEIMSRLASNGILLYDSKRLSTPGATAQPGQSGVPGTGPTPDPFAKTLVDVASRGIENPMSPEACLPIPIGFVLDDLTDVDPRLLMQLIEFPSEISEKLLTLRTEAITRLATALDMPSEYLTNERSSTNHWGLAQIDEDALKGPISSLAEIICTSLTQAYLYPMLRGAGLEPNANGRRTIVWYDPSELTVRPDRSDDVIQAYDRGEASGSTLRREIGIDEDAAPSTAERVEMALYKQATQGSVEALQVLAGERDLADLAPTAAEEVRQPDAPALAEEDAAAPPTRDAPDPALGDPDTPVQASAGPQPKVTVVTVHRT